MIRRIRENSKQPPGAAGVFVDGAICLELLLSMLDQHSQIFDVSASTPGHPLINPSGRGRHLKSSKSMTVGSLPSA